MENAKFVLLGAGAAALVLLYIAKKKVAPVDVGHAVADAVGEFAWGITDGAVSGVVYGIGDAIGVPRTEKTLCQQAIADGRTWDASKYCPLSDWWAYVVGPSTPSNEEFVGALKDAPPLMM